MDRKKKELKREYQQSPRPMGVYQIRNLVNDKVLLGSSLNLPGIFNRYRFSLLVGTHHNKTLQAEWNEFGSSKFAFEILDELTATSEPGRDYREELTFLEDLWLDKLEPYDERGYNKRKQSREEKLRQIAQNRLSEKWQPV